MYLAKNKELLERFRAGEREALREVYEHYSPGVRRFLKKGFSFRGQKGQFFFRGIASDDDLEASVQEVFRRAFEEKARNSYNGVNSFTNWVLAISRNLVINGFRNREIAISQYISEKAESGSENSFLDRQANERYQGVLYGSAGQQQDRAFEDNELKGLIAQFMRELTEVDRKILVHRFAEGRGQEETAREVGSTRMKVRTAEAKLRSRLRAFLRNSGYIDNMSSDQGADRPE